MRSSEKSSLALIILVLGLSGCATILTTIPTDHTLGPGNESVAIGRVTLEFLNPPLGFFANLGPMKLMIESATTGKDYAVFPDKSGLDSEFYVSLPPGRYRLVRIYAMNVVSELPPREFDVAGGRVQYVGTLRFRGTSAFGAGLWYLEDESEPTVKAFHDRYPQVSQPVAKPGTPEAWGSIGPGSWRMAR